jgi:hypothetical protein
MQSVSKETGWVKANKHLRSGGDDFVTIVTVSLFDEGGVKKMRVTSDLTNRYDEGTKTQQLGSTSFTRADTQAVLEACSAH